MTRNIEHLVAELAQDTAAIKPAPHPYSLSLMWTGAAAIYLAVSLQFSGLRPDLALALEQPWFVAEILVLALLLVTTAISGALLAFPDLHQERGMALAPLWAFLAFLLVLLLAWHADSPPAPLPVHDVECTLCIIGVALPPAALTFYSLRRFASTHYRLAGSIAILFAFSIGALWLRLHEVNDSVLHVLEWHYLPMLVAGIIGLWLGKLLLKW
jgi:hypothetical protein